MKKSSSVPGRALSAGSRVPFSAGALVVVTLGNPRDKFWGVILALAPEGLSISGIELASFDDLSVMVKNGEACAPAVVFFPTHRIERIELDLPDGSLRSLAQRFEAKTGRQASALLIRTGDVEANSEIKGRVFPKPSSGRRSE